MLVRIGMELIFYKGNEDIYKKEFLSTITINKYLLMTFCNTANTIQPILMT